MELLTIGRSECAIVDGTTNLQPKISAAPRPSHLLRFIHSPAHQEVNNGGQQPDVSHIDFFGTLAVVPAPLVGHGLPALIAIGVLLAGFGLWEHNNKRPLPVTGASATNCSGVGLGWSRFLGAFVGSALFGFGLLRRRNLSSRCGPPLVHERGA